MYKLFIFFCFCSIGVMAQPAFYSGSNAHSHNDYEQQVPFWAAYRHGFGSIEADIFLVEGNAELLVAHTKEDLALKRRRLDSLYLIPLVNCIRENHGHPYADSTKKLQLLIDVKTAAAATLDKLMETLERYPSLINNPLLQFVISGNRPAPDLFRLYPHYILFDGDLNKAYDSRSLQKIGLLSANLKTYTSWDGVKNMVPQDSAKLAAAISKAHALKKPVRFWAAPDGRSAWRTLMDLRVDYINTDHIAELSHSFDQQLKKSKTAATGKKQRFL